MVGPPQPRVVVGSPRPRVIVGTLRPRVIVGSTRVRPHREGTPRPQLAAEGSPRPRVVFGTPRARVIVGSPRPQVFVSSPWPAVVVASPRPRAPVSSPWPRVIVGTPRPRVIVGSLRTRAVGADQASAPSQGAPQVHRQDEHSGAGAERPRPGGAATGSVKTPLIRITRLPLAWTLRWNDLKCWVSPSVSSFGTLLDRRGSNALHQPTTVELKPSLLSST
uniref:RAB34, member RAS onco family n=1 Tax=Sciurus vulgaris TaxID=55149 RepID=A0A8D2DNR7_SCIVU